MTKASNPTMPVSKRSKSKPKCKNRYYEMKDLISWRQYDPGKEWGSAVGQVLLDFVVEDKEAISFLDFYEWYGIPASTYKRLIKKYKDLRAAHDFVKLIFANRREKGALGRKYEPKAIMYTLHKFHPVWKEVMDDATALRRELAPKDTKVRPTHLTVVMPEV